jgi:hypothetical protein
MDGGDEGGTDVSDLGLLFGILFNLAIVCAIGAAIGVAGHYVLTKTPLFARLLRRTGP